MSTTAHSDARGDKVHTFYRRVKSVTVPYIRQMYELYASHYDNTSLDGFMRDLCKTSGVILSVRESDDKIVGFATQTVLSLDIDGKAVRGVLSGDTVVDQQYKDNDKLGAAVYRFLIREHLRHPLTPFYWLLAAKSFKSYMLLARYCQKHFPGVGRDQTVHRRITQAYCEQLFPQAFDKDKMLLDFGESQARPRASDVQATSEQASGNPAAADFEMMNPTWRGGTEMPCLGVVDFKSILISLCAPVVHWIQKNILRNYTPAATALADQPTTPQQAAWRDTHVDEAMERSETS